jgi:hypothetical protein
LLLMCRSHAHHAWGRPSPFCACAVRPVCPLTAWRALTPPPACVQLDEASLRSLLSNSCGEVSELSLSGVPAGVRTATVTFAGAESAQKAMALQGLNVGGIPLTVAPYAAGTASGGLGVVGGTGVATGAAVVPMIPETAATVQEREKAMKKVKAAQDAVAQRIAERMKRQAGGAAAADKRSRSRSRSRRKASSSTRSRRSRSRSRSPPRRRRVALAMDRERRPSSPAGSRRDSGGGYRRPIRGRSPSPTAGERGRWRRKSSRSRSRSHSRRSSRRHRRGRPASRSRSRGGSRSRSRSRDRRRDRDKKSGRDKGRTSKDKASSPAQLEVSARTVPTLAVSDLCADA